LDRDPLIHLLTITVGVTFAALIYARRTVVIAAAARTDAANAHRSRDSLSFPSEVDEKLETRPTAVGRRVE
jgi:hypothetical protein